MAAAIVARLTPAGLRGVIDDALAERGLRRRVLAALPTTAARRHEGPPDRKGPRQRGRGRKAAVPVLDDSLPGDFGPRDRRHAIRCTDWAQTGHAGVQGSGANASMKYTARPIGVGYQPH